MSELADLSLLASGKVREIYDLGDTLLLVASDRISTYDVVHPTPIPDKGNVLTGLSAFWFEQTDDIVPNHVCRSRTACPEEARGRGDGRPQARDAAGRVRRPRLPERLRLEGLPAERARSAAIELPDRPAASPTGCPSRSSRRRRRRTSATTRRSTSMARSSSSATARSPSACATSRSRSTSSAAEHALERGIILADTKFELGLDADGELTLGDEVCTPDSLALLARRSVRARARRSRASTSSSCATGPRRPAGTGPRRRRRSRTRSSPRRATSTSRRTS